MNDTTDTEAAAVWERLRLSHHVVARDTCLLLVDGHAAMKAAIARRTQDKRARSRAVGKVAAKLQELGMAGDAGRGLRDRVAAHGRKAGAQ